MCRFTYAFNKAQTCAMFVSVRDPIYYSSWLADTFSATRLSTLYVGAEDFKFMIIHGTCAISEKSLFAFCDV